MTSLVQKRFRFPQDSVELYAEKVANRGLCAIAQAESLRYKLLGGLAVRRFDIYAIHFYVFFSLLLHYYLVGVCVSYLACHSYNKVTSHNR